MHRHFKKQRMDEREQQYQALLAEREIVRSMIGDLNVNIQKLKDHKERLHNRISDIRRRLKPLCINHEWYTDNGTHRDAGQTFCSICDVSQSVWTREQEEQKKTSSATLWRH